ncbi:unnamed protein product, partial [Ectocarpus sp. 4 AP-2014]
FETTPVIRRTLARVFPPLREHRVCDWEPFFLLSPGVINPRRAHVAKLPLPTFVFTLGGAQFKKLSSSGTAPSTTVTQLLWINFPAHTKTHDGRMYRWNVLPLDCQYTSANAPLWSPKPGVTDPSLEYPP